MSSGMERFAGRVAVVTGASSGIGAQIAEDLVRAGMVVVGVARRLERLQALAAKLAGQPGRLEPLQGDVSTTEGVKRVFKWVDDNLGGISVLVNNAAVITFTLVQEQDPADSERMVSTNFTAVLISCTLGVTSMKKHGIKDGHIINVNSVGGHRIVRIPGDMGSAIPYTSCKHGTVALTKGLRADLQALKPAGFKIRVTSLSPGAVYTEMIPDEIVDTFKEKEEALQPKDVSNAALFALSSPPAVEITELTIQPTGEFITTSSTTVNMSSGMERFAGRVAVVTGASSGIGAQIAEDLVRAGMVVVGVARRLERLKALAAKLAGQPGRLEPLQADLSTTEGVKRVFKWVDDNLGGISVLVNNAAVIAFTLTQDQDPADSEKMVSLNLTAVMIGCTLGVTSMKKHGIKDGHIINVNSIVGHRIFKLPEGMGSLMPYTSTKHATVALTKGLRADLQALRPDGFKIRVTSISPGTVDTEMLPDNIRNSLPEKESALQAKDVSTVAMFALSSPPAVEWI
ncbi:Farnesol dehydrogenase [Frankliniella fusca]|uniref:Farnesol dehydrogenase n=1 Tax=Frankliniella fusca TaxID=407009 RepID=A0AAE1HUJ4_9NEOP|nr:Farnesol dehydrogenase [Frankliniella fusca]